MFCGVVLYEGLFFFLFDAEGVLCLSYANLAGVPGKTAGVSPILASDWDTYVRDNFDALKQGHLVATEATPSDTRPAGVAEGTMVYTTDTDTFWVWSGSAWVRAVNTASLQDASVTASKVSFPWQSWSPVVTQSGNVTLNVNDARYVKVGNTITCLAEILLDGTAAVANNAIRVTLPVAPVPSGASALIPIGTGVYFYAAGGRRTLTACRTAVHNDLVFYSDGYVAGNILEFGKEPNFAVSLVDIISFSVTYECV